MTTQWQLSPHISLTNDRIDPADGDRQLVTAREICARLNDQPGVILADDVGMGKTFVALAVAVSVSHAARNRQVVVMVPSAVGDKWPNDWTVFREKCLRGGPEIRATEATVRRGSDFLKLLDDAADRRKHIIFLSHGALSSNLNDPFIKLAVVRAAFLYQRTLADKRKVFPRWAAKIINRSDFTAERVEALMRVEPSKWLEVWSRVAEATLDDDPVPQAVLHALSMVDLSDVRSALAGLPVRASASIDYRLREVRNSLNQVLNATWQVALRQVRAHLPLLILDEAHHLKNPNQLRSLFDTGDDSSSDSVRGAFGGVFERMLLLTATPFQLGHRELIRVLQLFGSTRMSTEMRLTFDRQLAELGTRLDSAQAASVRLERAWARLSVDDLQALPGKWWHAGPDEWPERVATAAGFAREALENLKAAQLALRPWVIRHSKERRRQYLPGRATLPTTPPKDASLGLSIEQDAVLPFLLAARAQAFVSLRGLQESRQARALFADGLASSFEAYLATRQGAAAVDDADVVSTPDDPELGWYLDRIFAALPASDALSRAQHPKIRATVHRTLHHWREGEKVLIFCFYRSTGRALREHLSAAIREEIARQARDKFGMTGATTDAVFEELGDRAALLRSDRPGGERLHRLARDIAKVQGLGEADCQSLGDVVVRFMRTPAFLTRYVDLTKRMGEDAVAGVMTTTDGSGLSFESRLSAFASRVAGLTDEERVALWDGLLKFRTGSRQVDSLDLDDSPETSANGVMLLPNVHLANGETDHEFRRRLMTTFNSPFLPEVLVASSVMAEGVDLHRECRHVIHHDLDWNPSTLEQRTGRVDRLGSKASQVGRDIVVCEPFVAGTQDEKQYMVVKDREKWFGVLMGGRVPNDEWATDQIAAMVPVPEALMQELTLDLSVWRPT